MRILISFIALFLCAGCATRSSNMAIGSEQSYTSLADQRAASLLANVATLPQGAKAIGKVDASRCHRRFDQSAPDEELVLNDLKVAAYAKGADGITNVKIEKQSALLQNCWYALNGEATAYRK